MKMTFARRVVLVAALLAPLAAQADMTGEPTAGAHAAADQRFITVSSTTSTQDSGLFGHILPIFQKKTGVEVRVVAQGTGQAIDTARRGDADVAFVHARAQEEKFVADGFGVARKPVMYNDFVLVGPKSDPAAIKGLGVADALKAIAGKKAPFVSRGDRSGTHSAELALWKGAGLDLAAIRSDWYREIGQGMGTTLNAAGAMSAYALADRGTWIAFKNKGDLAILVEGDRTLFNQYGVILVNPARHPHVKAREGQAFIDWLTGSEGQKAIADFRIEGQQLFFPNADDKGA